MKVFQLPSNQLPKYCIHHQSTPVKQIQLQDEPFPHLQSYLHPYPVSVLNESRINKVEEVEVDEVVPEVSIGIFSQQHQHRQHSHPNQSLSLSQSQSICSSGLSYDESFLDKPRKSHRVTEIQKKIEILRDGNTMLLSHIRKLFDPKYRPTKEDIEYLHKLFEADQRNVNELGKSLSKVNNILTVDSFTGTSPIIKNGLKQTARRLQTGCGSPCIRQWETCDDYSTIKSPSTSALLSTSNLSSSPQPMGPTAPPARACNYSHSFNRKYEFEALYRQHPQQQWRREKQSSSSFRAISHGHGAVEHRCCRRVTECEHNKNDNCETDKRKRETNDGALLRMESELKEIQKRVEKLTEYHHLEQPPPPQQKQQVPFAKSDWSIISVVEDDRLAKKMYPDVDHYDTCKNSKCTKNKKCTCGNKNKQLGKASKCVIT